MPTPSMEDYLEKIYQISKKKGYARVSDVAQALGLQLPSVSRMMQKMGDQELINYEKYGGIVLTQRGKKLGEFLHNRHQVLEKFLELLGVEDSDIIYQDVEGMEHHISKETLYQIEQFVHFAEMNPKWQAEFNEFLNKRRSAEG